MKEAGPGGGIKELKEYALIEGGTIQEAVWRDPVQVYQLEGRKVEIRKATYPSLWDCRKDQPI